MPPNSFNNFLVQILQKDLAKPHLLLYINYIFPKQNFNVLSGIMLFWGEVEY
jgi:hypothetical protein